MKTFYFAIYSTKRYFIDLHSKIIVTFSRLHHAFGVMCSVHLHKANFQLTHATVLLASHTYTLYQIMMYVSPLQNADKKLFNP